MFKGFNQLVHKAMPGKPVLFRVDPDKPTKNYMKAALEVVNLIKEKIDVRIKGQTCAHGSSIQV